ncbi:anaerobic ribonucleoside-triphosphate reductase [Clostridium putrefaciens]|uniref:Anaerobic ribonucleoside-triphosphate reductase n=1 Tax=Clostridium putrefaciens TaxID=99675 RepID=A0A381JC81_9CLOT|nr:ATP cone domain-containing protein [Clostridium putrefaciens]SUY47997.1 anaerobic ribonucleoside-triphosphate reductase [Clostridium putrefaciens]
MNVIKKNGRIEDFDEKKLGTSILNAALDANTNLTQGDINNLIKEICTEIKKLGNDRTSSYELFALTITILKRQGFKNLAKEYVLYSINS